MFRNNQEFSQKYFPILKRIFRFSGKMNLSQIDFAQPWYKPVLDQKWRFIFSLVSEMIIRGFMSFMPISIGWIFAIQNYQLFYTLSTGYFLIFFLSGLVMYNYCIFVANVMESVMYNAVQFFLVVDPISHTTRSSGQIIAKVNRDSKAFEGVLDLLTFDIAGALIGIVSVVISMLFINFQAGLWATVSVLLIASISAFNQINMVKITSAQWIEDEDKVKAINVETLQQVALIRSAFASNEQLSKIRLLVSNLQVTLATAWFSGIFSTIIIRTVFAISFLLVGGQIITSVQHNELNPALGISLLAAYLSSSSQVVNIGRTIEKLTDRMSRIQDLFEFISGFGQQTYPVLDENRKMSYGK